MLGKLKSMIETLKNKVFDYAPLKGVVLRFEGNGAGAPLILNEYNVASIVRTGVGVYNITVKQATISGFNIQTKGFRAISFVIQPSVVSDAHFVTIEDSVGDTYDVKVSELTVGGGNKLEVNPYDILSGDTIDISVLMNLGTRLAPE